MSIWTIILAAGASSRFGSSDDIKALASLDGDQTLLEHAVVNAPELDHVVVVLGAHVDPIVEALPEGVSYTTNQDWEKGIGSSIACGLDYISKKNAVVGIIVPVDQPFVRAGHLEQLARMAMEEERCVLTRDGVITGPPAAIPRSAFKQFKNLKSSGLKSAAQDYQQLEGPGILFDIDTKEDLARAQEKISNG